MTVLDPDVEGTDVTLDDLPAALTLSAEELVRGKREELLDRMEELARWRVVAEAEAAAMSERIRTWDVPTDDRGAYVLRYRKLNAALIRGERASMTLNAELNRRM